MRIARGLIGLSISSMLLTLLLSTPGCGDSSASKGTGPMLKDAPPAGEGQMSSGQFAKDRKKK